MKPESHSSGSSGALAVVLLLVALIGVLVVGFGLGFYLFLARSETLHITTSVMSAPPAAAASGIVELPCEVLAKFPLSSLDIKDTLEAPVLTIDPHKNVVLAYASQTKSDERTLFIARTVPTDRLAFGQEREVRRTAIYSSVSQMQGKEVKRPVRLVPQLSTAGDRLLLGWLEPNAENTTVFYQLAESTDGGETFGESMRVHASDGARPTFTALVADQQGNIAASWLDRRAGVPQPFASLRVQGEAAFATEAQVYSSPEEKGICPCCPTAALLTPDGRVIVAFRNQLDGYRDIYLAERKLTGDEGFGEPQRVVADPTWKFDGCPHDGPSLATDGQSLFVGWMDAHAGSPRCYVASRPLAGGAFSPPKTLPGDTAGNLKLAMDSSGTLHAVWEVTEPAKEELVESTAEQKQEHDQTATGSSKAIYYATCWRNTWSDARALVPQAGVFQSRPTIAVLNADSQSTVPGAVRPGTAFVAWNELDESGKNVVVVKVNY